MASVKSRLAAFENISAASPLKDMKGTASAKIENLHLSCHRSVIPMPVLPPKRDNYAGSAEELAHSSVGALNSDVQELITTLSDSKQRLAESRLNDVDLLARDHLSRIEDAYESKRSGLLASFELIACNPTEECPTQDVSESKAGSLQTSFQAACRQQWVRKTDANGAWTTREVARDPHFDVDMDVRVASARLDMPARAATDSESKPVDYCFEKANIRSMLQPI
jgi:hypothetical protein